MTAHPGLADTLEGALALAYQNNPQLNSQRAATRATDEGVGVALSGYRPKVSANAQIGEQYLDTLSAGAAPGSNRSVGTFATPGYGLTASQPLFDGFQTANRTRQAESQVFAARETLRNTVQTVLLERGDRLHEFVARHRDPRSAERNVEVLQEQLRQTRDRFNVGELTRTDVAQAELSLAAGRSHVLTAQSQLSPPGATYRQVIGTGTRQAVAGFSGRPFLAAQSQSVDRRRQRHQSASHLWLSTTSMPPPLAVKIAESALLPTLRFSGNFPEKLHERRPPFQHA